MLQIIDAFDSLDLSILKKIYDYTVYDRKEKPKFFSNDAHKMKDIDYEISLTETEFYKDIKSIKIQQITAEAEIVQMRTKMKQKIVHILLSLIMNFGNVL